MHTLVPRSLLEMLAPGLTHSAQLETLFQVYELGPDVFETRLSSLALRQKQRLLSALALARAYALHRERAASAARLDEGAGFPWNLLECLTPEIRCEAREWMGFWAQYRQGHWSEVQWVERGVRTHVNFEARELFALCLPLRPRAIVLVHNHPSGRTEPSWVDLRLTRQVGELAQHLGIELKGHWIVGPHAETWIPLQRPTAPDVESRSPSASAISRSPSPAAPAFSSSSIRRSRTRTSGAPGLRSSPSPEPGSRWP